VSRRATSLPEHLKLELDEQRSIANSLLPAEQTATLGGEMQLSSQTLRRGLRCMREALVASDFGRLCVLELLPLLYEVSGYCSNHDRAEVQVCANQLALALSLSFTHARHELTTAILWYPRSPRRAIPREPRKQSPITRCCSRYYYCAMSFLLAPRGSSCSDNLKISSSEMVSSALMVDAILWTCSAPASGVYDT